MWMTFCMEDSQSQPRGSEVPAEEISSRTGHKGKRAGDFEEQKEE